MPKAVVIEEIGGTDVLQLKDVPIPTRKQGEVLIRTESVGVNPVDVIVRSGGYAPEKFPKVGPETPDEPCFN